MGSPESVGVQSPGCSALVHLLHSGALALASTPGSDALAFLDRDTCRSRTASSVWHLAAVGGAAAGSALYTLRETAAPARFLTAVDGRLALVEQPPEEPLQLFRDLDRREQAWTAHMRLGRRPDCLCRQACELPPLQS